jgi:AcrR family transcriptional regulator
MGIKERHQREHDEVRAKILDAARELFVAEGYRHVSVRKVAGKVEYSPATLYGYFASKDDLFFALAEEGYRKLFEFTNLQLPEDPIEALREGFLRYYRFSRLHPEYFDLMFLDRTVPRIGQDWHGFAFVKQSIGEICHVVQRAIDAGQLPATAEPLATFHLLWAAVHGPATIGVCDRLAPGEDSELLARDLLEIVLAGLRTGVSTSFIACTLPAPAVAAAGKEGDHVESAQEELRSRGVAPRGHADHGRMQRSGNARGRGARPATKRGRRSGGSGSN